MAGENQPPSVWELRVMWIKVAWVWFLENLQSIGSVVGIVLGLVSIYLAYKSIRIANRESEKAEASYLKLDKKLEGIDGLITKSVNEQLAVALQGSNEIAMTLASNNPTILTPESGKKTNLMKLLTNLGSEHRMFLSAIDLFPKLYYSQSGADGGGFGQSGEYSIFFDLQKIGSSLINGLKNNNCLGFDTDPTQGEFCVILEEGKQLLRHLRSSDKDLFITEIKEIYEDSKNFDEFDWGLLKLIWNIPTFILKDDSNYRFNFDKQDSYFIRLQKEKKGFFEYFDLEEITNEKNRIPISQLWQWDFLEYSDKNSKYEGADAYKVSITSKTRKYFWVKENPEKVKEIISLQK